MGRPASSTTLVDVMIAIKHSRCAMLELTTNPGKAMERRSRYSMAITNERNPGLTRTHTLLRASLMQHTNRQRYVIKRILERPSKADSAAGISLDDDPVPRLLSELIYVSLARARSSNARPMAETTRPSCTSGSVSLAPHASATASASTRVRGGVTITLWGKKTRSFFSVLRFVAL